MRNSNAVQISALITLLPEVYQPIYGYPEISITASRGCDDRLENIREVCSSLALNLGRPLRVLDLGCAQGYFSLNLAENGATVHGVDFLESNIIVCQALAAEHAELKASFEVDRIEGFLAKLAPDQYDVVLGLSVFHHIVHETDSDAVQQMLTGLADKVAVGIFELALASEPLYWGPSQPQDPRQLLKGFAFVHELAQHSTHLSAIMRPLYVASNRYWCLNGHAGSFDTWQAHSHALAHGAHQGTRFYFFGNGLIVKLFRVDHAELSKPNQEEHRNETSFLLNPPSGFNAPRLLLQGQNEREVWLVRESLPGDLLIDLMHDGKPYDAKTILQDILAQLTALESVDLYHNDVRVWNVVVSPEGRAELIDYGAITPEPRDCVWPHNVFLSFLIFVRELISGKVEIPEPLRSPWLNPDVLPEPWRSILWTMLESPVSEWRFSRLRDSFLQMQDILPRSAKTGITLLLHSMEEASIVYKDVIGHWQYRATHAEAQVQITEERAQQAELCVDQVELRVQLAELRAQQAELRAQQANERLQQANERLQQADERLQQADERLQHADAQIKALLTSLSWRIMAPLRSVYSLVLKRTTKS